MSDLALTSWPTASTLAMYFLAEPCLRSITWHWLATACTQQNTKAVGLLHSFPALKLLQQHRDKVFRQAQIAPAPVLCYHRAHRSLRSTGRERPYVRVGEDAP